MNEQSWEYNSRHIGDIEDYALKQYDNFYTLWDNDILIAYVTFTDSPENLVKDNWVDEKYRFRKIFSMMLWFFKTRLARNRIIIGKVNSVDMQEVINGMSRFHKHWINIDTNELVAFDVNIVHKYYNADKSTQWRLMLENNGDFSDWPKFNDHLDFMALAHEAYVD